MIPVRKMHDSSSAPRQTAAYLCVVLFFLRPSKLADNPIAEAAMRIK